MPTAPHTNATTYDTIVVGSGFGGSVSALRLAEKGHRVLVLERGKRYSDNHFPRTNWNLPRYLWLPALRFFGFQQLSFFKDVLVLHGSGVGGGSLVYANVLMEPSEELFAAPDWRDLADWQRILAPHYATVKRMLGVTQNPTLGPADDALQNVATSFGQGDTLRPTQVGIFFGEAGQEGRIVPDPFFDGDGPPRAGCIQCGGCMVGCRYNAKNTLDRNYLYLAEKLGVEISAESEVTAIEPIEDDDHARYRLTYRRSTAPGSSETFTVDAKNVVISAGVLGTLKLLFHCRDDAKTLPKLSTRLGDRVRTNSEALVGATSRNDRNDYSKGIAITSLVNIDAKTHVEPVRYTEGASFIRVLTAPLSLMPGSIPDRLRGLWQAFRSDPIGFLNVKFFAPWSRRTTILLVMQTTDNTLRLKPGRSLFTLFRRGLVTESEGAIAPDPEMTTTLTKRFAEQINGVPQSALTESLLNMATTAHILGGVPMGRSDKDGVVDKHCEVFNYPGLYVVDGSIMPANPGINPSLTIAALAEYAMDQFPDEAI